MEEWNVVGYQGVKFTAPDGKEISGIRLHLLAEGDPSRGVYGQICDTQFISNRIDYAPMVGDRIQISFNRYGKVQSIQVI